jgi:superfamily II DNA or RNA helicase
MRAGVRACLLTGSVPVRDRARIVEELNCNQAQVLVATAQLIGEGFDLKQLSSIFLATPIKFTGRVKQYIGRILRISEARRRP